MDEHTYNAPTISAGTIARTACLLLALTNQVLSALGKPVLPIESRGAAGHRWHHHRCRAGRVVEEQQLHPRSPSGRPDIRQAEGTGKVSRPAQNSHT